VASLGGLTVQAGAGSTSVVLYKAGRYPVAGRLGAVTETSDSISVGPARTDRFDFRIDSPQFAGAPFGDTATLEALDPYLNSVTDYPETGDPCTISAENGDPMSNYVLQPAAFPVGKADLAAAGVTYLGRGGQIRFLAHAGPDSGISDLVRINALWIEDLALDTAEIRRGRDTLKGKIVVRHESFVRSDLTEFVLITPEGPKALTYIVPGLPYSFASGPETREFDFGWAVPPAFATGCWDVGMRLGGVFGETSVQSEISADACIRVIAGSAPEVLSVSPDTVGWGPVLYRVSVYNAGDASVTLDLDSSYLLIDGGRVDTVWRQDGEGGQRFLAIGDTLDLLFEGAHEPGFAGGSATAVLHLVGVEVGQWVSFDVAHGVPLRFVEPAALAYAGGLSPDSLVVGHAATVMLGVTNAGGVPIRNLDLNVPYLELRGAVDTVRLPFLSSLPPLSALGPDDSTLLSFALSASAAGVAVGRYPVQVALAGEVNNLARDFSVAAADTLVFMGPPSILVDSVWIDGPPPPVDQEKLTKVSTRQHFTLSAQIRNTGSEVLESILLRLVASEAAQFDSTQSLTVLGLNGSATVSWDVIADSVPVELESFQVHVDSAFGRRSGEPAIIDTPNIDQVSVQVQSPSSLSLTARITSPPQAVDRRIPVGMEFVVEGQTVNSGQAETGGERLRITVDSGFQVLSATVQGVPPYTPAFWRVVAPPFEAPGASIRVSYDEPVQDRNTGEDAYVEDSVAVVTVDVVREAPPLVVYDVPSSGGAVDTEWMPLRWFWCNEDRTGLFPILLESLTVELLAPADARVLEAADYLTGAQLEFADDTLVADSPTRPLHFGNGSLRLIAPGDSEEVKLRVFLRPSNILREFQIATRDDLWHAVQGSGGDTALDVSVFDDRRLPLRLLSEVAFQAGDEAVNYPNPFRAGAEATRIQYRLAADGEVDVTIYTVAGREVWSLHASAGTDGGRRGTNEVEWDGRNGNGDLVVDGIYVAHISGAGLDAKVKIAVIK
jgi:hypothetical protein